MATMVPLSLGRIQLIEAISALGANRDSLARWLPAFEPGELIGANVQRRLGDGSFTVELQGHLLRMNLPSGAQPGDRLSLAYVGNQPRLTFLLRATQAAAEPAPQLSAAGRFVASLIGQAGALGGSPSAPTPMSALLAAAPLLVAPTDAAPLAAALGKSLTQSGLFYEAHQAQWAGGTLALSQLRQEPQARLPSSPVQQRMAPVDVELTARPSVTLNDASQHGAPAVQPAPIHPSSLPIVQQQLGALESGRVGVWVEIWPRQWMSWEIEEEGPQDRAAAQDAMPWRTTVRLDLALLGKIDATLTLRAEGLHVVVKAANGNSASLLASQRVTLRQALEGAGLSACTIAISALESP